MGEKLDNTTSAHQEAYIEALHQCENPKNVIKILDSNNKYSYGAYMFQMGTWLSYGKKFGATKENINDDDLQKIVARSMLDAGLSYHWLNCSHRIEAKLGKY